jgi:hypothetical protein
MYINWHNGAKGAKGEKGTKAGRNRGRKVEGEKRKN